MALMAASGTTNALVEGKQSNLRAATRRFASTPSPPSGGAEKNRAHHGRKATAKKVAAASTTNKPRRAKAADAHNARKLGAAKAETRRHLFEEATVPYLVKPMKNSAVCLDVKDHFLYFHECSASHVESQQWYRDTDGHIKNVSLGSDKCLDYHEYDGVTFFEMIDCTGANEHGWDYTHGHIVSNYDRKCLELYDVDNVVHEGKHQITLIATSTCDAETDIQNFNLIEYVTGSPAVTVNEANAAVYKSIKALEDSDACLDIVDGTHYVEMTTCDASSDTQQWSLEADGHIHNKSDEQKCLDYCPIPNHADHTIACLIDCDAVSSSGDNWSYDDGFTGGQGGLIKNNGGVGNIKCLEIKELHGGVTLFAETCNAARATQLFEM